MNGKTSILPAHRVRLTRRAADRAHRWIAALEQGHAWDNAIFETLAEPPEQKYCYHDLSIQQRRNFWDVYFEECAYQFLAPAQGVVHICNLISANNPLVREDYMHMFVTVCDSGYSELIAPHSEYETLCRTVESAANTFAGFDIRIGVLRQESTVSHNSTFKSTAFFWRQTGNRALTLADVPVFTGVRRNGKPFTASAFMPNQNPLPVLVVNLP